ncbi:MAG: hypothetical protein ACYTEQ_25835 [Planctomycetota bacterium]|jgi:hypothetical protein
MKRSKLIRPLTNAKVNDIWRSGFCNETVEHARLTTADDAQARINFLRAHVKTCKDCYNANIMKAVEHEVAKTIGPHAEQLFCSGGDIATLPGFQDAFKLRLDELMQSGIVGEDYVAWMARVATRATQDYAAQRQEDRRGEEADKT